ncbi:hypothetical protein LTR10_003649 [Elasticomyces elasticus]|nr:hypothetical protein LTR10_003649 [Elasticomyces elasticus]
MIQTTKLLLNLQVIYRANHRHVPMIEHSTTSVDSTVTSRSMSTVAAPSPSTPTHLLFSWMKISPPGTMHPAVISPALLKNYRIALHATGIADADAASLRPLSARYASAAPSADHGTLASVRRTPDRAGDLPVMLADVLPMEGT